MTGEIIKNVRRIRKNIGSFLFYIRRRVSNVGKDVFYFELLYLHVQGAKRAQSLEMNA